MLLLSNLNETNIMFSRALGSAARVVKFNSIGTVYKHKALTSISPKIYLARSTHQSRWHFDLFIGFA
jgi:hypothetical protein